jgi:hypothetical protein
MPEDVKYPEIAELMLRLKARTTLSFTDLGKPVHFARPTVARYFNGQSLPDTFEPLEQLARMCRATEGEVAQLHRRWQDADRARTEAAARRSPPVWPTPAPQPAPPPQGAVPAPPAAAPSRRIPRRRPHGREWGWVTVPALLAVALALVPAFRPGPSHVVGTPPVFVPPQAWEAEPAEHVAPAFFGVTVHGHTGKMPSFSVGAVRVSESGTTWSNMEPAPGQIKWDNLEREVAGAQKAGLPVMFTFSATPAWAAPNGNKGVNGITSPPEDLHDWDRFVNAVSARFKGRINAYELWILVGDDRYYSGLPSTMVQMTKRARDIIRRNDPAATLVCPSMGDLYEPKALQFLQRFADLGGYGYCDVAGVKLYPQKLSDPPEHMFGLVQTINRTFRDLGISPMPTLWDTGTAPEIADEPQLNPADQINYAVRFFLVGLFARYGRMYFYNWGGDGHPVVLQVDGDRPQPPTPAGLAVGEFQRWMRGAQILSCGAGAPSGLPDYVFRCRFALNPSLATTADVVWTSQGSATITAARSGTLWRLNGSREQVHVGQAITVTGAPILVPAPPS